MPSELHRPGRLSIALAQLGQRVGDLKGNMERMLEVRAKVRDADLVMFPELQLTGYPPEDLVLSPNSSAGRWS